MANKPVAIVANQVVDLLEIINGRHRIAVSVGPDLQPVVLSLAAKPDYRVEKQGANFPKQYAAQFNQFVIHFPLNGDWIELEPPRTRENYHFIQPLENNHWLLVRGRTNGDADFNSHIFTAGGVHVRSFSAGDGIRDVQTDDAGRIWVSYFDEGVFGDTKLGRSGLVCLDNRGGLVFDFLDVPHPCVESMADCYALNVCSNREVWLCYYTDFPLVQLFDFKLANLWPKSPFAGSSAFAVHGGRALFVPRNTRRPLLYLVELGSQRQKELLPVDGRGERIVKFAAFARRSSIFLLTEESLYSIDLAEVQ